MSRLATCTAAAALFLPALLSAQDAAQRFAPSGRGTSEIVLMLPDGTPDSVKAPGIRVDHGQPHMRGRSLHQDTTFVPYDRVWRTGANATSTFATDLSLQFGTTTVAPGRYVLATLPAKGGWTLILQKEAGQQGGQLDDSQPILRIPLRVREMHTPVESLSMWLIPSTEPGAPRGELRIVWGTVELSAPFTVTM